MMIKKGLWWIYQRILRKIYSGETELRKGEVGLAIERSSSGWDSESF